MKLHKVFHMFTAHWHYPEKKIKQYYFQCVEGDGWMRSQQRCCICGMVKLYDAYVGG